jgi:prefoldin subunit 5
VADESLVEAIETLRRDVEQLQRQLAATRAWCVGLEEEQTRLDAKLQAAGGPTGGT